MHAAALATAPAAIRSSNPTITAVSWRRRRLAEIVHRRIVSDSAIPAAAGQLVPGEAELREDREIGVRMRRQFCSSRPAFAERSPGTGASCAISVRTG